jgi:hypothetical protein
MLQVEGAAAAGFELVAALGQNPALEAVDGCPSCYQEEAEEQLEREEWLPRQCMIAGSTAAR